MLWIDIIIGMILRGELADISPVTHRDFHTNNPRAAHKYQKAVTDYMTKHRMEDRSEWIKVNMTSPADHNANNHNILNEFDADLVAAMRSASKQCRSVCHHPNAPILNSAKAKLN